jgi:hypothetical protein
VKLPGKHRLARAAGLVRFHAEELELGVYLAEYPFSGLAGAVPVVGVGRNNAPVGFSSGGRKRPPSTGLWSPHGICDARQD